MRFQFALIAFPSYLITYLFLSIYLFIYLFISIICSIYFSPLLCHIAQCYKRNLLSFSARSSTAMNAIRAGMNEWTRKTCISFKKRNGEASFVRFQNGAQNQ